MNHKQTGYREGMREKQLVAEWGSGSALKIKKYNTIVGNNRYPTSTKLVTQFDACHSRKSERRVSPEWIEMILRLFTLLFQ
jgi:hypothetical protein